MYWYVQTRINYWCKYKVKLVALTLWSIFLFLLVCIAGLSAPVPRGRKGKKLKNQLNVTEVKNADWLVHCNPEVVLQDESYKKHLKQHCNKSVH